MLLKDLPFRIQTDRIFTELGITPLYSMECDHLLHRELINANAGVTIASQSASFRHLYSDNIRFLDIEDPSDPRDRFDLPERPSSKPCIQSLYLFFEAKIQRRRSEIIIHTL